MTMIIIENQFTIVEGANEVPVTEPNPSGWQATLIPKFARTAQLLNDVVDVADGVPEQFKLLYVWEIECVELQLLITLEAPDTEHFPVAPYTVNIKSALQFFSTWNDCEIAGYENFSSPQVPIPDPCPCPWLVHLPSSIFEIMLRKKWIFYLYIGL